MITFQPQAKSHPDQFWNGDTNQWAQSQFLPNDTPWNNYNAQNPWGSVDDFQRTQPGGNMIWDPLTGTFKKRLMGDPNAAGTVNPGTTDLGRQYEGQKMASMQGGMNPIMAYRKAMESKIFDKNRGFNPLTSAHSGGVTTRARPGVNNSVFGSFMRR